VLSLLLRQGKDYAEIADMLGIPDGTVRARARAALDVLEGVSHEDVAGPARTSPPPPPARAPSASPRSSSGAASSASSSRSSSPPPSSRRAGALLLGAIAVVVILAVVLLTRGGGASHNSASSTTASSGSSTGASAKPHVDKQLRLAPPNPASKALGVVQIVSQGSRRAFFIAAENLPPSSGFFYAAWLYNSPSDKEVLGRAPPVTTNGRLQAVALLPANAGHYRTMLITRETNEHPGTPGPIVLRGAFGL
jgi:hypothetical protein